MRIYCFVCVLLCAAPFQFAAQGDSRKIYELIASGKELSSSDADKLESKLAKKPKDEESRITLLAYYSFRPASEDVTRLKPARARHILWLIENDPKEGLGLFQTATGIYRIHCSGDSLADSEAFEKARMAWLAQIMRHSNDKEIRSNAVNFLRFCAPEDAEKLLLEVGDKDGLGSLYATAVLGITGESYANRDFDSANDSLREGPFAQKAFALLEQTPDPILARSAAFELLRSGADLWADGKLKWDYTKLGNALLAKVPPVPDDLDRLTLPLALPNLGERPPRTLRVGGNVQFRQLVRKVAPAYPPEAAAKRIEGTVQLTALLGLDGNILGLRVEGGPKELIQTAVDAARQWQYRPTMLNGKPVYILTRIDINFTLSAPKIATNSTDSDGFQAADGRLMRKARNSLVSLVIPLAKLATTLPSGSIIA